MSKNFCSVTQYMPRKCYYALKGSEQKSRKFVLYLAEHHAMKTH